MRSSFGQSASDVHKSCNEPAVASPDRGHAVGGTASRQRFEDGGRLQPLCRGKLHRTGCPGRPDATNYHSLL